MHLKQDWVLPLVPIVLLRCLGLPPEHSSPWLCPHPSLPHLLSPARSSLASRSMAWTQAKVCLACPSPPFRHSKVLALQPSTGHSGFLHPVGASCGCEDRQDSLLLLLMEPLCCPPDSQCGHLSMVPGALLAPGLADLAAAAPGEMRVLGTFHYTLSQPAAPPPSTRPCLHSPGHKDASCGGGGPCGGNQRVPWGSAPPLDLGAQHGYTW